MRGKTGSRSPKNGHRNLASFGGREGRGMHHDHHEHAFHPAPCCPSCGEAMRFVRSIHTFGFVRSIHTFECHVCKVWITEACEPPTLEVRSSIA